MNRQLRYESWLDDLAKRWQGCSAATIAADIIEWLEYLSVDYTRRERADTMAEAVTVISKRHRLPVLRELCRGYYDKQHSERVIAVRALLDWIDANR
jgi:hypothetical protein